MDPLTRLMDDGDERLTMKNRLRRIAAVAPPSIIRQALRGPTFYPVYTTHRLGHFSFGNFRHAWHGKRVGMNGIGDEFLFFRWDYSPLQ